MSDGSPDDETLMLHAAGDNRGAFDLLVHRWVSRISIHCRRMVSDQHIAEDVAQDVLLKLWRFREKFQSKSKFSTYLWRITNNTCLDKIQSLKREGRSDQAIVPRSSPPKPEEILMRSELEASVEHAIARLSDHQRGVLLLRHYEGLKFREIAEVLGVPEGTVCSRMAEAMVRLQQLLGNSSSDHQNDSNY